MEEKGHPGPPPCKYSNENCPKRNASRNEDHSFKKQNLFSSYKTDGNRTSFKPTCYACGVEGHVSRFCPSKNGRKGTNVSAQFNLVQTPKENQEDEAKILTVQIDAQMLGPHDTREETRELKTVNLRCGKNIVKGIIDSGTQISVIRADLVSDVQVEGGKKIKLVSAFGKSEIASLKIIQVKIDDEMHGVVPVTCAVSHQLASDMLVCPVTYETLLERKQLHGRKLKPMNSKEAYLTLEKSLETMKKTNCELLEENFRLTQNSGSQVPELQQKIKDLTKSIENLKNHTRVAEETADQARTDCQNQIKLMHEVQEKYERESLLHAQDVQAMAVLKEEHQTCSAKFEKLSGRANIAEQILAEGRESWSRQEEMFKDEVEALRQRLKDLEQRNRNSHEWLDFMGTQMATLKFKNWNETSYVPLQLDLKETQHLRQVSQLTKKDIEIASTHFDVVQSENVRLMLKVDQMTKELYETKSELNDVLGHSKAKISSDVQHADLLKKVAMLNFLTESNNLPRMGKQYVSTANEKIEDPHPGEAKTGMNQLQTEFNNYKKEKNESERLLNEQMDKMSNDISDLRIQNARLASQSECTEERIKMLLTNLEMHKKGDMSFKDRNMAPQETITLSGVTNGNLKSERDLLKNDESRLLQGIDSDVKERQHQNCLMANLQAVQNLEQIVSETKRNLQHEVKKLGNENSILKLATDFANEEYRSAVEIWKEQNKESQSKADAEVRKSKILGFPVRRSKPFQSKNPLTYFTTNISHGGRLTRWELALQRYNVTVSYRKGSRHGNADALSRLNCTASPKNGTVLECDKR